MKYYITQEGREFLKESKTGTEHGEVIRQKSLKHMLKPGSYLDPATVAHPYSDLAGKRSENLRKKRRAVSRVLKATGEAGEAGEGSGNLRKKRQAVVKVLKATGKPDLPHTSSTRAGTRASKRAGTDPWWIR